MTVTRRRFLAISAAALALPRAAAGAVPARWRGVALGASASITLAGVGPVAARPVFARLEAELERLERIFSLYRDDSAICRLNRAGRLGAPPAALLEVLSLADALHAASGGAFDPTVQPLWWAVATGGDTAAAARRVGWAGLHVDPGEVRFARPGMALTLNGIAQGYVTDRIAALLGRQGFRDILVDMGEIAATGRAPDGTAWQAGVARPDGAIVRRVTLRNRALATSAPGGTMLAGGQGHILGPHGAPARQRLVAVSAPGAMLADGLSTALCLLDRPKGQRLVDRFPGARVEAAL